MKKKTVKETPSPMETWARHEVPIKEAYDKALADARAVYLATESVAKKLYDETLKKAHKIHKGRVDEAQKKYDTDRAICKETYYSDEVRAAYLASRETSPCEQATGAEDTSGQERIDSVTEL